MGGPKTAKNIGHHLCTFPKGTYLPSYVWWQYIQIFSLYYPQDQMLPLFRHFPCYTTIMKGNLRTYNCYQVGCRESYLQNNYFLPQIPIRRQLTKENKSHFLVCLSVSFCTYVYLQKKELNISTQKIVVNIPSFECPQKSLHITKLPRLFTLLITLMLLLCSTLVS